MKDLDRGVPLAPLDLLEVPQGAGPNVLLGEACQLSCLAHVLSYSPLKLLEIHEESVVVDATVNPPTIVAGIMKTVMSVTLVAALLLSGCSKETPAGDSSTKLPDPSQSDAQMAFEKLVKAGWDAEKPLKYEAIKRSGVPDDATDCGVMGGNVAEPKLSGMTLGIYNAEGKYWPAKITFSAVCESQVPNCGDDNNQLCPPKDVKFTLKDLTIRLTRDDFGAWDAAILGEGAEPWGQ